MKVSEPPNGTFTQKVSDKWEEHVSRKATYVDQHVGMPRQQPKFREDSVDRTPTSDVVTLVVMKADLSRTHGEVLCKPMQLGTVRLDHLLSRFTCLAQSGS